MSLAAGVAHLQARLQATLDRLSVGGACKIRIYDGTKPASPATAVSTQVLLAEFTMSSPAGTITGSNLYSDLTLPADATVLANGTASWSRFVNGAGTAEIDSDVSLSAGTEAVKLATLSLVAGGSVHMTSARLS